MATIGKHLANLTILGGIAYYVGVNSLFEGKPFGFS